LGGSFTATPRIMVPGRRSPTTDASGVSTAASRATGPRVERGPVPSRRPSPFSPPWSELSRSGSFDLRLRAAAVQKAHALLDGEALATVRTLHLWRQRIVLRRQQPGSASGTLQHPRRGAVVDQHLPGGGGDIDHHAAAADADVGGRAGVVLQVPPRAIDDQRRVEGLEASVGAAVGTAQIA